MADDALAALRALVAAIDWLPCQCCPQRCCPRHATVRVDAPTPEGGWVPRDRCDLHATSDGARIVREWSYAPALRRAVALLATLDAEVARHG